jgi:uncharacterized coiled-coil protein SlyX
MKQITMESIRQRIADLESAGKVVGGLSLSSEFELACLRELVAVTEHSERVSKSLETALGVQADQAKRTNQLLGEIKKAEAVIGSLGWMDLDTAISLELTKLNKQISDLQGQVSLLTEQRDALVVEMKSAFEKPQAYLTWHAIPPTWEDPLPCGEHQDIDGHKNSDGTDCWPVYAKPETPATDAAITALRAEGVEMFAKALRVPGDDPFMDAIAVGVAGTADNFARQLRESKGATHG